MFEGQPGSIFMGGQILCLFMYENDNQQVIIRPFRRPIRSETQPENTLRMLAVDSATPSIRPIIDLSTPRTLVRKRGTSRSSRS